MRIGIRRTFVVHLKKPTFRWDESQFLIGFSKYFLFIYLPGRAIELTLGGFTMRLEL